MGINYIKRDNIERYENDLLRMVRERIAQSMDMNDDIAMDIIRDLAFSLPGADNISLKKIGEAIEKTFYRTRSKLGILKPLIEDEDITEIMVNGPKNIFFEKGGVIKKFQYTFSTERELEEVMQKMASEVHREINELNPIVDARLNNGSRVSGVYKNIAVSGPTLTIRKFSDNYMHMDELVDNGTLTREAAELLTLLVSSGYNIFVSGGTSSGKTTLLNALSSFIGRQERVIIIEDSTELRPGSIENIVQMECRRGNASGKGRVDMSQLIKASLRMRPDRIIVGEVRGPEVLDMLQAMNTGHSGSMSTGHGNSTEGMLKRLETMYLMAVPLHIDAVRAQIAEGIDIMIHIEKLSPGRRITEIDELLGYEKGSFVLNKLMTADNDGVLKPTGNMMQNIARIKRRGERISDELQKCGIINL